MPIKFRNDVTSDYVKTLMTYDAETGQFFRLDGVKQPSQKPNSGGYLRIRIDAVSYKAHRLAWLYHYGEWPEGELDHINGIRTDNRVANLRDVPHVENQRNMKRHREGRKPRVRILKGARRRGTGSISPVKGGTRWIAKYKRIYLGFFASPEAAEEAIANYLNTLERLA